MATAVKLRDRPQEADRRSKVKARAALAEELHEEIVGFRDKSFGDLSAEEKDDLLRILAIRAGVLKE